MTWDTSSELMSKLQSLIEPVRARESLREVLANDFPRDCSQLPISGGWGYAQTDAIKFERALFPVAVGAVDFVSLEYHIAQKLIYEELIIFQPDGRKFSGIDMKRVAQNLMGDEDKRYDRLRFSVSCWSDWHWEQLKKEWEENDFGKRAGFDAETHHAKRMASQITYEREFWFDITDVLGLR